MAKELNFKKELIGNFGYPVWENPTEAMVEAAFTHHNMPYRYVTTEVKPENLKAAFEGVKAMGYKGFNCTLPHKVAIIEHLDGLGQSAQLMQAVNCVVEREGKYIGENTDGKGFLESLAQTTDPSGKRVTIFGAGGAARAVSVELALAGVSSITIVNRKVERGQKLLHLLQSQTQVDTQFIPLKGDYSVSADTDILINCTSIGLYPQVDQRVPVKVESLLSTMTVCDLIPNPPQTTFLREAHTQGCTTIDGLGMLVNQGKIGIAYWSGVEVDTAVMRRKLEELFG